MMTTNQTAHAGGPYGEVIVDSASEQPVIPTQRGAPDRQLAPPKHGEQRPILVPCIKDRAEFIYKMQDVSRRAAHTLGWHLWHAPMNALRMLWFAACGLFYIVGNVWVWTFDLHSPTQELTNEEYVKLNQNRERRLSQRGKVVGVGFGIITLAGLTVWWLAPVWASWSVLVGVVIILALVGRPRDKPLLVGESASPGEVPLNADTVREALCSLGIPKMTRPEDIQLLYAVKPSRAGYIIDITLPRGVTATEVMAKREKLSSGLQRGIGTVWPSVGERHAGHLEGYRKPFSVSLLTGVSVPQ